MVRKLLKRKLKLLSRKKLKTSSHGESSLGHWAIKQLLQKQNNTFLIRYPPFTAESFSVMDSHLHHKQLLSAMVNGSVFLHSVNEKWKQMNLSKEFPVSCLPGGATINALKKNSQNSGWKGATDKSKNETPGEVRSVRSSTDPFCPPLGNGIRPWSHYKLLPLSRMRTALGKKVSLVRTHWKSIYSFDQLMCHQYYAQFTRKHSPHKAALVELKKCSAVYGKLLKKQRREIIKRAQTRETPLNYDNIPLLMVSRLDQAVQQCFAFKTITSAHHWISQGKITVNLRVIKSPSHLLKPGDCIAISQDHKMEYKTQLRALFHTLPRERKYVQSGRCISRWKTFATLYNNLRSKHTQSMGTLQGYKKNVILHTSQDKNLSLTHSRLTQNKDKKHLHPWPDRGVANFWYATGRFPIKCLDPVVAEGLPRKVRGTKIRSWLARHRWRRRGGRTFRGFTNWKSIYRRRIFVFSQWLLSQNALINDGLYYCRWKKAFIRKKSDAIKKLHKRLSLQKPLHFEISYKKLCAIFLYPPQKVVLPTAIDFKKL